MTAGHGLANGGCDALDIRLCHVLPRNLVNQRQPLLKTVLQQEGGTCRRTQCQMALLRGSLDVLRVVVLTADDQELLDSPRHVQLSVIHESEVARSQIARRLIVCELRMEDFLAEGLLVPIACCQAWPGDPDFAD